MALRIPLALGAALVALAGCDTSDPAPSAVAEVEFTQTVDGEPVVVGRFDAAGPALDLRDAFRTTVDVDPRGRTLGFDYSEDLGGFDYLFLLFDDGDGPFSLDVSLLAPGRGFGPNTVVDLPPRSARRRTQRATAEITVFAVATPGVQPRGQVEVTFLRDAAPDQVFTVDLAEHAVDAPPALRVVGSDLDLVDGNEGFGYAVRVGGAEVDGGGLVPLSVYRTGYLGSTETCRAGDGGAIAARWEATTAHGLQTGCAPLDPSTFEYSLFLLERERR